jgi:type II secretory pathway pseudopilin PulG
MAAPSQTQRLQQQQQQFAAANQQVQQVQRAQDDQLAELQVCVGSISVLFKVGVMASSCRLVGV